MTRPIILYICDKNKILYPNSNFCIDVDSIIGRRLTRGIYGIDYIFFY